MWVVPDNIKDLMWGKLVAKFEYPEGCNMAKAKSHALSTMAIVFKNLKGKLWRNYYLVGRTPKWDDYPMVERFCRLHAVRGSSTTK